MHGPAILNEIETKKPRHDKILKEYNNTRICRSKFDPRDKVDIRTNSITDNDFSLANTTDGIVLLIREHNVRPTPDINDVSFCKEVITIENTETTTSIYGLVDEYKHLNSNWEEYDNDFISFSKLDKSGSLYLQTNQKTKVIVMTGISTDRGEL